jgi:hypothetical protein
MRLFFGAAAASPKWLAPASWGKPTPKTFYLVRAEAQDSPTKKSRRPSEAHGRGRADDDPLRCRTAEKDHR